jgi:Transglutaminase-like domain
MLSSVEIFPQSSLGTGAYWSPLFKNEFQLNSFESNVSNLSFLRDWGLSFSYGGEFSNTTSSNLYMISISKTLGDNNFTFRYTPGYQKEFTFNNDVSIIIDTTSSQSLNSYFTYKELFGMGYSYRFSQNLSAGFTLRYFNQEFNSEGLSTVIKVDSIYLQRINDVQDYNFWKWDFGINYLLDNKLSFSISSQNLLKIGNNDIDPDLGDFELRTPKEIIAGISYLPISSLGLNVIYESNNSFLADFNGRSKIFGQDFGVSISVFHDETQQPYLAGLVSAISYSNDLLSVSLSSIKYFLQRNNSASFDDFKADGISNIINNKYSFDKILLNVSFALNTLSRQEAKLINVEIEKEIYPALEDDYLNTPFAVGKVVNLTDKRITVKPYCKIEKINSEKVQSPQVEIDPGDTAEVKFYALMPQSYSDKDMEISTADFSISTQNDLQDQFQKPILVRGINSWDGNVSNLKYFIEKDYNFSMKYSKNVISSYKAFLDTIPYALSNFYKAKYIFNNFIKKMVYASDPRASVDYVQYPHETLELKGGNCDDFSVLYSSLLESIGIQTALIDYKPDEEMIGHVSLMFNTELSPNQAKLITGNDRKFFVRKNDKGEEQVWIVVETTSLTNFDKAWDLGSQKFDHDAVDNFGLVKGNVAIVNVN